MPKTKTLEKDSAGAIGSARDMVAQIQEQAKNGQIDGAMLDQLQAILNVSVDAAADEQSSMQSDASTVTDVATAPDLSSVPDAGTSMPSELEESDESEESTTEETTMDSEVQKSEPLSARPPGTPTLVFDKKDEYESHLGDFVKAMENGRMKDAQTIAGGTSSGFDTMFNMAQLALMKEGGWTSENIGNLSSAANVQGGMALQKSITASSVPGIYLIRLAKMMLPVYAGLVNRLPVDSPKGMSSNQAIWKAQLGFGSTLDESDFFRIAESSIGVEPPTSFLTFTTSYNDLSVTDNVTLKAIRASQGYSDPLQIAVVKSMSALLRGQERVILGGNKAAIAAPGVPTVTSYASGTAQTVLATGSYIIGISALTYEGWVAGSKGGTGTVVGETAATFPVGYTVLGSGSVLKATWAAVPGAVAYNVYLSGSGCHISGSGANSNYHQTVTVNTVQISTLASSGSAPLLADTTVNATYGIEGIIPWCEKSTIYSNVIPDKITPTDNAGAALTAGNGGITQFDTLLASAWTTWHTAPSVMIMSPLMNAALVGKLQSLGSGNFYRVDVSSERNTVNGGMMVTGYVNKFAPFADGTPRMIDVIPHPYMPNGTVLFLSETIPYPMGNESRGFVRDVLMPYTYFPLPSQAAGVNKIRYDFAVTTSEVLECFNPGPQMALQCVDHTT